MAGMALAVLASPVVAAGWGTSFEQEPLGWVETRQGRHGVPAWTRPCWRRDPRHGTYTLPCGRLEGRVLYVQAHDPDGDGDAHVVVLAGARVVVIKVARRLGIRRLPGLGQRVRATGLVEDGPLTAPSLRVVAPEPVR